MPFSLSLNSYFICIVIIVLSSAASIAGLLAVRRLVDFEKLRASHEVGGYLLSVVGTLYGVVLGLVVVDAMQHYQAASEIVVRESNNLADVYILSKQLPEPRRSQVRNLCRGYAEQVLDTEWQQMRCSTYCAVARGKAVGLMEALMNFEPKTENEKAIYPQLIQEASQFWQNRQARINIASKGLPPAEWTALIVGALILVVFTYLFGLENLRLQILMTTLVSMLISLNFILLLLFAYPFSGDLALAPDAFHSLQEIFMGQK